VSDHFAAQIGQAKAGSSRGSSRGLIGQAALSAVSLRVEPEIARHQAREAREEVRVLKTRLARSLGEEIAVNHLEQSGSSATVEDELARIEQLLVSQRDLRRQLRDGEEELEAARCLNGTLIRERNSGATERQRSPPSPIAASSVIPRTHSGSRAAP
jgi:hypothetical protein